MLDHLFLYIAKFYIPLMIRDWRLVITEAYDQDLAHSLDKLKSISIKVLLEVVICDKCDTENSLFTATSIHSIQKGSRNCRKQRIKLAS